MIFVIVENIRWNKAVKAIVPTIYFLCLHRSNINIIDLTSKFQLQDIRYCFACSGWQPLTYTNWLIMTCCRRLSILNRFSTETETNHRTVSVKSERKIRKKTKQTKRSNERAAFSLDDKSNGPQFLTNRQSGTLFMLIH